MYKVHDPVKIKDLPVGPGNDMTDPHLWFSSAMKQMVGKVYHIGEVYHTMSGGIRYRLEEDITGWEWIDCFLIPAQQRTE